jgi:hypothetical protein
MTFVSPSTVRLTVNFSRRAKARSAHRCIEADTHSNRESLARLKNTEVDAGFVAREK